MRNMLSVLLLLMLSMRHAEELRGGMYGPGLCQYFPSGMEICKSFDGLAFALFVACITVVEKNPDCMICLGLLSAVPVLAAVPTYVFGRKEDGGVGQGGDVAEEYRFVFSYTAKQIL